MKAVVQLVTPPAAELVSPAELYAHCKLNTGTAEYPELTGFAQAARELFEKHTGRAVLPTTFRQWLPRFCGPVDLLRGPVTEVTAVSYYDADGDLVELDDGWELDASGIPAVVYMPAGDYPTVSETRPRPVCVDFTAGWADGDAVPAIVKTAIKLMAGHWYRFREAYTEVPLKELPSGFRNVVDLFDTGLTRGG